MRHCFLPVALLLMAAAPAPRPLINAHSHNDYERPRPLVDALECGFCSVEADVYLIGDQLMVAHTPVGIRPGRTLESLYLAPLAARVRANGGRVHREGPTITLLIDLKTDGPALYAALRPVLQKYAEMLTRYADGKVEEKAVTIILSGNRPIELLAAEKERLAFIDGRLEDLETNPPATLTPWISGNFAQSFKWRGQGEMPADEMRRLKSLAGKAHEQNRRIRFWSIPDQSAGWRAMRCAGVDLINTDKLEGLRDFLINGPSDE